MFGPLVGLPGDGSTVRRVEVREASVKPTVR
jgi:hypothetical protein